jgi:hypothetical protein
MADLWHEDAPARGTWAFRLGLGMALLGVICRVYVYLLSFPIWRDEASLALSFVSRDFRGLLRQLENFQVAPVLFLWIEKAVYQYLGASPALLRLMPLLAGVLGFVLFWLLARRCLSPLAAALAVGILAVAQSPIHLAAMIKPYSLDLFTATLLLTLAIRSLHTPERPGKLAALALVTPFVVVASYPAIFVAGAVSLVLLPVAWRRSGSVGRYWFVAFNVLCGAAFAAHVHFVGREGHDPTLPDVRTYMAAFWDCGFLPHEPLSALRWLVRCHTGHMLSYPVPFNGGGSLGLLIVVAGARALYRQRQLGLLALCLLPFALNFASGVLRRYPYAGDQRLEQHLVPGLCLLLGSGIADLIRRLPARRVLATATLAALLVLIGLIGSLRDALHPYQDVEAAWVEDIARYLRREVQPQDQIVFPHVERFTLNCLRWQLLPFAKQVCTADAVDWQRLERGSGRVWFVDQMVEQAPAEHEPSPRDPRKRVPELGHDAWLVVRRVRFLVREPKPDTQQVFHYCCDLHLWSCTPRDGEEEDGPRNKPGLHGAATLSIPGG